jgi:hypothetical protein
MGANRFARGGRREEQGHQSAGGRCGWRGLYDEPRPDAPRQIDDDVVEVVRQTLETTPRDARHWSLCSMAKAAGVCASRRFIGSGRPSIFSPIAPRRSSSRRLPICREGARYCRPSPVAAQRALILCVAEKSQIEGLDRFKPLLPMRPGQIERRTHYYTPWSLPVHGSGCRDRQGHRAVAIRVIADASS